MLKKTCLFLRWDLCHQHMRMSFMRNGPLPLKMFGGKPCVLFPRSCPGHTMELLLKRACGQPHVSLYSLWVVQWGGPFYYSGIIFRLQFNMTLLRDSQSNFLFLPQEQASVVSYFDTPFQLTNIHFVYYSRFSSYKLLLHLLFIKLCECLK